jgi:hypothetical protein
MDLAMVPEDRQSESLQAGWQRHAALRYTCDLISVVDLVRYTVIPAERR